MTGAGSASPAWSGCTSRPFVAVVLVVYFVCRRYAGPLPAVVATMLFVAAGQGSMTPRPQLVSYVLLVVLLEAWRRTEQDLRPRWWLDPAVLAVVAVPRLLVHRGRLRMPRRCGDRPGPSGRHEGARSGWLRWPWPAARSCCSTRWAWACSRRPFEVSQTTQYVTEWARPSITSGPAAHGDGDGGRRGGRLGRAAARRRRGSPLILLASALFWDWYAIRTDRARGSGRRPAAGRRPPVPGAGPNRVGLDHGAPRSERRAVRRRRGRPARGRGGRRAAHRRPSGRRADDASTPARPAAGRHGGLQRLRRSAAGSLAAPGPRTSTSTA